MTPRRLLCHPSAPEPAAHALEVRIERAAPHGLRLLYRLTGDLTALRLPEPAPPVQSDGLWHGTCFEAFLQAAGAAAYVELNACPSGAWALYGFDGYRTGMRPLAPATAPRIVRGHEPGALNVEVRLDLSALRLAHATLQFGIAAVLQNRSGALSYWALTHPGAKPDFHHPCGFTGRLLP